MDDSDDSDCCPLFPRSAYEYLEGGSALTHMHIRQDDEGTLHRVLYRPLSDGRLEINVHRLCSWNLSFGLLPVNGTWNDSLTHLRLGNIHLRGLFESRTYFSRLTHLRVDLLDIDKYPCDLWPWDHPSVFEPRSVLYDKILPYLDEEDSYQGKKITGVFDEVAVISTLAQRTVHIEELIQFACALGLAKRALHLDDKPVLVLSGVSVDELQRLKTFFRDLVPDPILGDCDNIW
ncbi:hypothetical protein AURDEDRAFT_178076 [Auricularia subglabra TFB-10046 SS5]|nr:hypothetical protein AURDEDRAFT_178076 [Auricularia subglabra TFB-10046 SS5]